MSNPNLKNGDKVNQLRILMEKAGVHAYFIPTADAHQSEYVAECDKRRAFISEFTGSAGTAVVLASSVSATNKLWTDGRYFLQATQQLEPSTWELMKQGTPGTPSIEEFLVRSLPPGSAVGVDPTLLSVSQFKVMASSFKDKLRLELVSQNLVDLVWANERSANPNAPLILLSNDYTGKTTATKIEEIRAVMNTKGCNTLFVTALDEVAWLLNLRGADIPFNPVFISYAVLTLDKLYLYIDGAKITPEVTKHLGSDVEVRSYKAIFNDWKEGSVLHSTLGPSSRAWIDPARCNVAIYAKLPSNSVFEGESPIQLMKAIKNQVELEGIRNSHIRDAAAMCCFLEWLEGQMGRLAKGLATEFPLDECSVSDKLESFRKQQKDFVGLSFETISGVGSNGAIIHYKPEPETCAKLSVDKMYLCDSGAQFKDGTTDITRTMHYGQPSDFEKECYTRVLKGHIDLALAVFPPSTTGFHLDILARNPLNEIGLNYNHGTGHGVGAFLNVHEGPHGISYHARSPSVLTTFLQPGMVVTNEPGYYHDGGFGIRIENVMSVVPANTPHRFGNQTFLTFDTITLVPIQTSLIQLGLLTDREIEWLNQYHKLCADRVGPLLATTNEAAYHWLLKNTAPISRK